jgi:outer membrane receptor protein involved in Fe transport
LRRFKNGFYYVEGFVFQAIFNIQKLYCMTRILLLSLSFLLLLSTLAVAQTSIYGKVTDEKSDEDLIYANLVLSKNGVFATGASTDFEGNYSIPVDPGTYEVKISYTGYPDRLITDVIVKAGQGTKLDIQLSEGIDLTTVVITGYKVPLIQQDNTTQGGTLTSDQIRNLPTKNITALAAATAGLSQVDEGDAVTIRGSRDNATNYYIDGIRVSGSGNLVPQSEIDQLQIITGGMEAQYGDVTGGIISITTKGPSARFGGGAELETSEGLDPYGYRLASMNLSGPILKKKTGESILGFRFSGQYLKRKDDDPPATDIFVVKDDVLAELEANPVTVIGPSRLVAAEFLTNDDVKILDYKPNEGSTRYDLTGKLDARLSKAIDVTLTGSYNYTENQFTPGTGVGGNSWRLMNSNNNPTDKNTRYRGNFRLRHRFGGNAVAVTDEGEAAAKKGSLIRNAQYTITVGYEKRIGDLTNPVHGDNYFDYGYVGKFDRQTMPTTTDRSLWSGAVKNPNNPFQIDGIAHSDYTDVLTGFTPGTANPGLNPYNNSVQLVDDEGVFIAEDLDFVVLNGLYQTDVRNAWDMWSNVNQVYNTARKIDNDLFTLNVSSSFDFLPGGSEKGRHSIQFGILYEQEFNRQHQLNPFSLWQVARQQANLQIMGIDTNNIIGTYIPEDSFGEDVLEFTGRPEIPLFSTLVDLNSVSGNYFWQRAREITGQSEFEFVNVDAIDPSLLSLDDFSAQELNDAFSQIGLDYYGYDYTGKKLSNKVSFDDFFTGRDENNVRTFQVAANKPIYAAAYIQDKFTFKDIIFRVGLRVDQYDANTKVMKDARSLYEIETAGEFFDGNLPTGVESDFLVYNESADSEGIKGYRRGDQWYFADGTPANDGNVIFGTSPVFPAYKAESPNIRNDDFKVETSFEDYTPQINWMPRLAFSFPISDDANFFAHYDILVQRPPSNALATALDFYYFTDRNDINNPNLKPERTVDYEVGFQQKLSNTSAIKIAAYYKELRDMIQARTFLYVPIVNSYETSDNQDFGTVKGFTFQYDLRRTNNITASVNYTLQFADGTGSDANSSRGSSSRGTIRTLFPLNFDERHRVVTSIDYRYGSGKVYNGPRLLGKDIFANAGLNLQAIAVSGRPYSASSLPSRFGGSGIEGQINGSRLPWNFTLNMRIDKSFKLSKPGASRNLGLNVYLRVQNLLDKRNVLRVYTASGSATDDGFLATARGQEAIDINSSDKIESFLSSYQWRLLNADFYSLPRRIFLGAEFTF